MPLSNPSSRFASNGSIIQTRRQRRRQHLSSISISTDHSAPAVQYEKARMSQKASLRKLEIQIPQSTSGMHSYGSNGGGGGSSGGLMTPLGTQWTVVGLHPSTPVSAIASTHPCLILPMIEVQAQSARQAAMRHDMVQSPLSTAADPQWFPGGKFADNCPPYHRHQYQNHPRNLPQRRSATCPGPRSSRSSLNFQRFREDLWRHGANVFGNSDSADVFVKAVQLPRSLSEEPPVDRKSSINSSRASSSSPPLSASFLPSNGRLTVRAVLHSKSSCAAVGLAREFELEKLQATIPAEPLPPPSTPNFDRRALFSALRSSDASRSTRSCSVEIKREDGDDSHLSLDQIPDGAIPMHIPYARAQLPALAAIMMSSRVGRGDTIDLAVPHPGAWPETVAYVYTGEGELLTEPVRDNILYLGGRV